MNTNRSSQCMDEDDSSSSARSGVKTENSSSTTGCGGATYPLYVDIGDIFKTTCGFLYMIPSKAKIGGCYFIIGCVLGENNNLEKALFVLKDGFKTNIEEGSSFSCNTRLNPHEYFCYSLSMVFMENVELQKIDGSYFSQLFLFGNNTATMNSQRNNMYGKPNVTDASSTGNQKRRSVEDFFTTISDENSKNVNIYEIRTDGDFSFNKEDMAFSNVSLMKKYTIPSSSSSSSNSDNNAYSSILSIFDRLYRLKTSKKIVCESKNAKEGESVGPLVLVDKVKSRSYIEGADAFRILVKIVSYFDDMTLSSSSKQKPILELVRQDYLLLHGGRVSIFNFQTMKIKHASS